MAWQNTQGSQLPEMHARVRYGFFFNLVTQYVQNTITHNNSNKSSMVH